MFNNKINFYKIELINYQNKWNKIKIRNKVKRIFHLDKDLKGWEEIK